MPVIGILRLRERFAARRFAPLRMTKLLCIYRNNIRFLLRFLIRYRFVLQFAGNSLRC